MTSLPVRRMLGVGAGSFGANVVNAFSNTVLPLILDGYGFPHAAIGFLAQERSLVGALVQPLIGAISDRLRTPLGRRKPFFLVGVPLTAIALVAIAIHPPAWAMAVLLSLFGLFLALAVDPYNALIADLARPEQRGPLGGVMGACNMAGQVVLLLGAFLLYEHHQPWLFAVIICGLIAGFAITFFSTREPHRYDSPPTQLHWRPVGYLRSVLAEHEVTKYAVALFFYWLGNGAAVPFLTQFAVHVLHASAAGSYLLVFVAVATAGILAFPVGLLARRLGKKRVLSWGLFAFVPVTLIGSQLHTFGQGVVAMACIGACNSVTTALVMPLLADLIPQHRAGEFTGLGSLVWSIAQPIGAVAAGAFIDLSGTYRAVFVVAGLLFLVSAILLQTVRATAHAETPEPATTPASLAKVG